METIFDKIISKEIPAAIIYEDNSTMAFLDVHPCSIGHTVVIPKKRSANIMDTDDETLAELFRTVKKVTKKLKKALKADGFSIGLNQEKAGGQTVDHIHVHVIPRFEGDKGGNMHTIIKNPPKEGLAKVAEIIEKNS
ncbi:MAG: HIT family protein [bacterium]|nr:HIT family protein [bacterium]